MLTRLLFLLTLLMLTPGLALAGAQAAGYEVETAVYKDLRQDLTIDTVPGVSFSPVSGRFGLGFEAPITWVRLTLRPIDSVVDRAVDRAAGRAVDLAQPLVLRLDLAHALQVGGVGVAHESDCGINECWFVNFATGHRDAKTCTSHDFNSLQQNATSN